MAKNVVGLFDSQSDAQAAMDDLHNAGFTSSNARLLRTASSQLAGTFERLGIPRDDVRIYQEGVQQGGALIILQQLADDDVPTAAAILEQHNLVDIDQRVQGHGATTGTARSTRASQQGTRAFGSSGRNFYQGGEAVIPIVEEELQVGKRAVEGGGVRVTQHVEETPVNTDVTLRDETVHLDRRPADRPASAADMARVWNGTFEMREHDEQAVVSKAARVVEEVVIEKDVEQRTETIQDSVRRTEVDVQEIPGQQRTTG